MTDTWTNIDDLINEIDEDLQINSIRLPGHKYKKYVRRDINIEQLKIDYKGKPFRVLIKRHLNKREFPGYYHAAINGMITMLPQNSENIVSNFIDRWLPITDEPDFWGRDTSEVFSLITNDARGVLQQEGLQSDDETIFNMFLLVVLTYVCNAAGQRKMRKYIGI